MSPTLLDLPTELLDHIFSYLDWDRKVALFPTKPDITNSSLVCKQLRQVLLPPIFKDVVLRLRWLDGALVEPDLFRLRRQHPELAKHIRSVLIRTEFEQCPHCAAKDDPSTFTVPPSISDWSNPSNSLDEGGTERALYRSRANAIAQRICPELATPEEANSPAKVMLLKARGSSQSRMNADALAIAMLCVPVLTHTVIFQSLPDDSLHESRNAFALRVLATTVELLGSNLSDLTLVSTSAVGMSSRAVRRRHRFPGTESSGDSQPLLAQDVIQSLKIKRLTIALTDRPGFGGALSFESVSLWHGMSDWVRELDIRRTNSEFNELLQCIKGFQSLQVVHFQESALFLPLGPVMMGNGLQRRRAEPQRNTWLVFVIELRQAMQHVKIQLSKIYTYPAHMPESTMPESGLQWMLNEAVPAGALIDADRQERLLQDFDSFLPLWAAEDSDRGAQATESWATQRGLLCDGAMNRRWK